MKKFLSFSLALAMTASLVPATAFAATDAKISNVVTVKDDKKLSTTGNAPIFTLTADGDFKKSAQEFYLKLENAEFDGFTANDITLGSGHTAVYAAADLDAVGEVLVEVSDIDDNTVLVKLTNNAAEVIKDDATIDISLANVKATGGTATISVDADESEISETTKTIAKTSDGDTDSYVSDTKNFQDGGAIENLFIKELVAGTIDANGEVKLRVNSGFEFKDKPTVTIVTGTSEGAIAAGDVTLSDDTITIKMPNVVSTKARLIKVAGITIKEDGAEYGDKAEITVNGGGTSKKTVEVGTYVDFGVSLTAKEKELPVIYAGTAQRDGSDDAENELLEVTLKENVVGSWIEGRKMTLTLPEGVEFVDVEDIEAKNFTSNNDAEQVFKDAMKTDGDNEIDIQDSTKLKAAVDKKREVKVTFSVAADSDFTGDVVLTATGSAIANEKLTATVATVKAPIEVKTSKNEVKIDYKNTAINDITLVEPAAGLWEKGDVINLKVEEMKFEGDIKAEVASGDMKLDKLKGDNVQVTDGVIKVKVDSKSSKEPATIKISGVQLYLQRSLPAGDYELTVYGTEATGAAGAVTTTNKFFMNNYHEDGDDRAGYFETEDVTVLKDFVTVVTAGRDQGETFTTKITVPVGADKILAGAQEITVDSPAYINKDGYTMLPVRAITEALNGVAIVRWDDTTKTATISFGSRVFSMTVGSKVMNMNGVSTNLLAAPEIKNSRIFLPLRDLGYALGLTDSKIAWDAATSTATLN